MKEIQTQYVEMTLELDQITRIDPSWELFSRKLSDLSGQMSLAEWVECEREFQARRIKDNKYHDGMRGGPIV